MTFYDVLGLELDASVERIERAVDRHRSALSDGSVYPARETVDDTQLRREREELVEEAARVLLDQTEKMTYDTFLRELGAVDGHLEYLHWRGQPDHCKISPEEWIEETAQRQNIETNLRNIRILRGAGDPTNEPDQNDRTASDGVQAKSPTSSDADAPPQRSVLESVWAGLTGTLWAGVGVVVLLFETLRYAGRPSWGWAAIMGVFGLPIFIIVVLRIGLGIAELFPGLVGGVAAATALLSVVLLHLFYILTPRIGIPGFGVWAAAGYLVSTDESTIVLTLFYVPCCLLSVIVLYGWPTDS